MFAGFLMSLLLRRAFLGNSKSLGASFTMGQKQSYEVTKGKIRNADVPYAIDGETKGDPKAKNMKVTKTDASYMDVPIIKEVSCLGEEEIYKVAWY